MLFCANAWSLVKRKGLELYDLLSANQELLQTFDAMSGEQGERKAIATTGKKGITSFRLPSTVTRLKLDTYRR
jgi:hypothetical protein